MHDRDVKSAINIWRLLPVLWLLVFLAGCKTMPAQPEGHKTASQPTRMIKSIETINGGDTAQVIIKATQALQYTSVKQAEPPAVVLIFPATGLSDVPPVYKPKVGAISSIRSDVSADGRNVRMEIDLVHDLPYEVTRSGDNLRVAFSTAVQNAVKTMPATPVPAIRKTMPAAKPMAPDVAAETAPVVKAVAAGAPLTPAVIEKIDFSAGKSGRSSIVIGTGYPVSYQIEKISDRLIIIELENCTLPRHRRNRPLITTRFETAVDRIIPVQAPDETHTVDIIVELRERVPYRTEQSGNLLFVHFDPSSIGPRPFSEADLPPWKEVLDEAVKMTAPAKSAPGEKKPLSEYERLIRKTKEYTGQPIALDFYETNIKNVFRILQQVSGKNYAIDPDVTGSVTISMEKPVPWDQVLDLILTQNKLGMVEDADIIRIAKGATLQAEDNARRARITAFQKRKEQEKALEPLVTEYIPINYANAKSEILPHIKDILSKDRGKISVDGRNNQLIITDVKEKIEKAREIIAQIDKVTPQVVIEARIVEVSDDFTREIGSEWGIKSEDVYRNDLNGFYSYNVAMNNPANAKSSIGFDFVRLPNLGTPLVLNAKLAALEDKGEGKIVSAPKIVTLDNKKATISQGFEYPYTTTTSQQGAAISNTQFKEINMTLEVTPHVTPDRRISLIIHITKDDIDKITDTGEPALSTNEAQTELLVDDGSTLVIGGIMKTSINTGEKGFPILKDIPIVGWLFKSTINRKKKNELLIFMTPRIVQLDQRELAGK